MDQATIYHEPITSKLQMHYYVLISQFSQVTRCHVFKQVVLSFPPVQVGGMAPKGFDLHQPYQPVQLDTLRLRLSNMAMVLHLNPFKIR